MIKKYSKKDISPEKRHRTIDKLKLKQYNNGISKNHKVSKTSQQNNSETVTNENDEEIPKEIYIATEERQNVIDNLRLIIIV